METSTLQSAVNEIYNTHGISFRWKVSDEGMWIITCDKVTNDSLKFVGILLRRQHKFDLNGWVFENGYLTIQLKHI